MKNKKVVIVFIIVVIIVAILAGIYKIMTCYMFEEEMELNDGHKDILEFLNNIEKYEDKEMQVKLYLDKNVITEDEAKEILEK